MLYFTKRLTKLIFGLFLYALGIVFTLKANIGFAPWEVFHTGLGNTVGISIGVTSILTGLVIVAISALMGEKIGLGTLLNMLLIGLFLDFILFLNLIPKMEFWLYGFLMLVLGLFVISLATYFYISSGFGAGPRDSFMVALTRKTGLPVGLVRSSIELIIVVTGWLLGGMAGLGTLISVVGIGFCLQLTFRALKFVPTSVHHASLQNTFKAESSWVK
ncbi:membrane protein [Treponema sp.]